MSDSLTGWAIVEVMGHRRFAGAVSEQEIAGRGFVRVDVPETDGQQGFSKLIGTGSIYAITPVDEHTARAAARAFREVPLDPWILEHAARQLEAREPTDLDEADVA